MAWSGKWGVLFSGDNLTLAETVRFAAMAEDAGADSVWTTELGRDAFVPLAGIAAACALDAGVAVRNVEVQRIRERMRAQGADPGDRPACAAPEAA